jgi:hypothetical protein
METMNCTDFNNLLDDYCDGELGAEVKSRCDAHLATCQICTDSLATHRNLLSALRSMPIVGPSDGFEERVLSIAAAQNATSQNNTHHRRGFMMGFGSAAVAALALWAVIGMSPSIMKGNDNAAQQIAKVETNAEKSVPEISIALNQKRDIQLAFYSSRDLKGAQITLQVPQNVAVAGFPGQRKLVWKTNLAKGNNLLRLPLVANGAQGGELVAHIEYKGKIKTLKVKLAVNA